MPLSAKTGDVKPVVEDTCTSYVAAPVDVDQFSVGVVETPVAPFKGIPSAGAAGADGVVVKL
jgi:hypothetical protein